MPEPRPGNRPGDEPNDGGTDLGPEVLGADRVGFRSSEGSIGASGLPG